jgi:hypothetical protein
MVVHHSVEADTAFAFVTIEMHFLVREFRK